MPFLKFSSTRNLHLHFQAQWYVRTIYFSIKKLHSATQCIYKLHIILIMRVNYFPKQPLPAAVWSKALVCSCLTAGPNPAEVMGVRLSCLLCFAQVAAPAMG